MAINFRLTGDAGGTVKAVRDINEAAERAEDSFEDLAGAASKAEKAAKRIREAADPLERYKRQVQELEALKRQGLVSQENVNRSLERYQRQLERAGQQGRNAFGQRAIQQLAAYAGSFLSINAAINTTIAALREVDAERKRVAEGVLQGRGGLASLAQLAAPAEDPRAAYRELLAEARAIQATGAVENEQQAGDLLFRLVSAGLDQRDRDFAVRIKASGALANVGGAAEAFSALRRTLGAEEVGGFQDFVSKAIQASTAAPAQASQIPLAAARSGQSARNLGITDEFVLAATALAAGATGTAEQGGTQISAFFKQVEKAIPDNPQLKGKSGLELVRFLAGLPPEQTDFGGILGDRAEAIAGFRTLRDNLQELDDLFTSVSGAPGRGVAATAAALPMTDTQVAAANLRAQEEARRDRELADRTSAQENAFLAIQAAETRALRTEGVGESEIFMRNLANNLFNLLNLEQGLIRSVAAGQGPAVQSLSSEQREVIRLISEGNDISREQNDLLRGGVEGRQE